MRRLCVPACLAMGFVYLRTVQWFVRNLPKSCVSSICSGQNQVAEPGSRVGVVRSRSRIPNNTGSRSRIFLSDSGCPIPKSGIPVEMVQFFETFVESEISCCVPRLPLIFTARFHFLHDMLRSRGRKFWKGRESDVLPPTPQPWSKQLSVAYSASRLVVKL